MRDVRNEQENTKLLGIAAIVASIPNPVWYAAIVLIFIFLGITAYFHRDNIESFVTIIFVVVVTIAGTSVIVHYVRLAYRAYTSIHTISMQSYERQVALEKLNRQRLQNEILVQKVEMQKQLPIVLRYAMEQGHNVEYDNFKVSNYLSNVHMLQGSGGQMQLPAPNIILPAKTEMIAVARRQDFTPDNIFLAQAESGDVTTTIGGYVHCANDGSTGSGKTTNWRGQLVQFVKAGIDCILLNPHFSPTTKAGDDWRPIARALESQGSYDLDLPRVVTRFANIGAVLCWLATIEIDRRFDLLRKGCFDYEPLYAYIDEWPSIVTNCKEAPDYMRTILQRGRAVEVCVSVNSQGFLANDTDLKGSARENFDTAFFMGGSTYSGAKMLDLSEKTLKDMIAACNEPLGKGVAFLRNNVACFNAQLVRLPYADNEFVYHCLGRADGYQLPPEPETVTIVESSNDDLDIVHGACITLKEMGEKVTVDRVTDLVPFSRGKVGNLMKALKEQGIEVR